MVDLYITKSDSQLLRISGILQLDTDNKELDIRILNILLNLNSITLSVDINPNSGLLITLNNIYPYNNGNIDILGNLCTSLTSKNLELYLEYKDLFPDIDILLYDGCLACDTCSMYWLLNNMLELSLLWVSGLKDNILYYLSASNRLWLDAIKNRSLMYSSDSLFNSLSNTIRNCKIQDYSNYDRNLLFGGLATKLLYQYKAAVALWNYIVNKKSSLLKVTSAPLTPSGLSIIAQIAYNACNNNLSSNSSEVPLDKANTILDLDIVLELGQTSNYTQLLILELASKLYFFVQLILNNTGVIYRNDNNILPADYDVKQLYNYYLDDLNLQHTNIRITFSPLFSCGINMFTEVRIFPVLSTIEYPSVLLSFLEYIKLLRKQKNILTLSLKYKNRWKIYSKWTKSDDPLFLILLTTYYLTIFCLDPNACVILE